MQIIQAVVGAALLAFGRKGLGLFLGALGLMVGVALASTYVQHASTGIVIAAMVAGGVLGVVAAFFVQKVAVVLAGILGGGYAGYALALYMGWVHNGFPWIPVAICAVLGIILAHMILKWALIILSSVAGSYLLVGAFDLSTNYATPIFVVLAIAGIWFQASSDKPKRAEK
jgi:hypothetical protein